MLLKANLMTTAGSLVPIYEVSKMAYIEGCHIGRNDKTIVVNMNETISQPCDIRIYTNGLTHFEP